ncbi:hypothetical protein B296_00021237 [Ensete ventricosum]|uniref:Uncharacterized protein n=1 Tax=Ensete ventricosum TaxID=4639 RepID=A0A426Y4H9_ENSVE|nr:hypothetical protein B296_00021237 [Ensete ventricosum]
MQAIPDDHEPSPNMIKPKPMGLITHNRIYVCIDTSPYPVIADLVIIVALPRGGHPYVWRHHPCWRQGWPRAAAPCGRLTASPLCERSIASGYRPLRALLASLSGWPWLQPAAPVQWALAIAWPWVVGTMGAGHGWPPLLLAAFATKTQQEHIQRFYVIQSHHTQFKTNLSHENFGSDTTIGKPQREHHMRRLYIPVFQIWMEKMKKVKRPHL